MIKNYSHRLAALLVALLTTVASMAAGITLNLRKVTVKKAMERIENVSNVRFFYKDNLKDLNKVVTLQTQDASVEKCLELLFAQTDISYKIDKNNVVILQRKGTTSATADEPTGNLDTGTSEETMELLTGLFRERGTTFILVSHDPGMRKYTDRTITFSDGRISNTLAEE